METIKYFTQKELKKLFKAIEDSKDNNKYWLRDLCIFKVGYVCALRASEIGLLHVSNFNSQKGEMYCKRLKGSQSNTIRIFDVDKSLISLLKRYINDYGLRDSEKLFKSQLNKPISRQSLDRLMKLYCEAAKIADVSKWHFHTLKHSIAVHLADSGLDTKELQYYLGHKNINNTQIYFQFTTTQQDYMYSKIKGSKFIVS